MIRTLLLLCLLPGCRPKDDDDDDTLDADVDTDADADGDDTAGPSEWGLLADELGTGMLLSAWSDGDVARIVGGDMAGGSSVQVRWDGSSLCVESNVTERALWWIHGDRPGRWVAVGEAGTVLLEEDGVRTRMDIDTDATLYGTWVTADRIVAVGGVFASGGTSARGEIWVHENGEWTDLTTSLPDVAFKVWEDWVVGVELTGQIEGDGFVERGGVGRLLTTRGRAADDVWAVGGLTGSLVQHWDGSDWSEVDAPGIGQPLMGVWTAPGEDVWVAGNFGTTAYYDGSDWTQPDWPVTSHHFHAVWPHGDHTLFLGGNFFSAGNNFGTIGYYGPAPETVEAVPCD